MDRLLKAVNATLVAALTVFIAFVALFVALYEATRRINSKAMETLRLTDPEPKP